MHKQLNAQASLLLLHHLGDYNISMQQVAVY